MKSRVFVKFCHVVALNLMFLKSENMLKIFLLNVFNSPPPKQGNAEFGPSGQITVLCADFKFKIFTPPENHKPFSDGLKI